MMRNLRILGILILLTMGCAAAPRQRPNSNPPSLANQLHNPERNQSIIVSFGIQSLIAYDLEEIGADEIVLHYMVETLSHLGELFDIDQHAWHGVVKQEKALSARLFPRLAVRVPAGGKAVFSARLEEDDDHSATVEKVRLLNNIAKIPLGVIATVCGPSSDPACIFFHVLGIAMELVGIAAPLINYFDPNDDLGKCKQHLQYDYLRSRIAAPGGTLPYTCVYEGENNGNQYRYQMSFNVRPGEEADSE